jgi:hypothetical protein
MMRNNIWKAEVTVREVIESGDDERDDANDIIQRMIETAEEEIEQKK